MPKYTGCKSGAEDCKFENIAFGQGIDFRVSKYTLYLTHQCISGSLLH